MREKKLCTLPDGSTLWIVRVTPDVAREWLASSAGNRKISPGHVDELARQILADEWEPYMEFATFDRRSHLIDGHHRGKGVIQVDKGVDMLVRKGASDRERDKIDLAIRQRVLPDVVTMHGIDNSRWRVAVVRLAARVLTGWHYHLRHYKPFQEWTAIMGDGIDWLMEQKAAAHFDRFRNAGFCGVVVLARISHARDVDPFIASVIEGSGLTAHGPAWTLRNYLTSLTHLGGGKMTLEIARKTAAMIKAHLDGVPRVAQLRDTPAALDYFRQRALAVPAVADLLARSTGKPLQAEENAA